jgi:hypothetical protein
MNEKYKALTKETTQVKFKLVQRYFQNPPHNRIVIELDKHFITAHAADDFAGALRLVINVGSREVQKGNV